MSLDKVYSLTFLETQQEKWRGGASILILDFFLFFPPVKSTQFSLVRALLDTSDSLQCLRTSYRGRYRKAKKTRKPKNWQWWPKQWWWRDPPVLSAHTALGCLYPQPPAHPARSTWSSCSHCLGHHLFLSPAHSESHWWRFRRPDRRGKGVKARKGVQWAVPETGSLQQPGSHSLLLLWTPFSQ